MRQLILLLAASAALASCSRSEKSAVRLDLTGVAAQAQTLNLTLHSLQLTVAGPEMDTLATSIDPRELSFTLEVPAGAARHFVLEVRGAIGELPDITDAPLYWGEATADLEPGTDVDLEIFAWRAGIVRGRVIAAHPLELPAGFEVSFTESADPTGQGLTVTAPPTSRSVRVNADGRFTVWLPGGASSPTMWLAHAEMTVDGVLYTDPLPSNLSLFLNQGFEVDLGVIALDPPGCTDYDRDGFCTAGTFIDCNDLASSCTTDCASDVDGDFVYDCSDRCIDRDGDAHGLDHTSVIVGAGDIAVGECTDGSSACTRDGNDVCAGPDCDDITPYCFTDCTNVDNDGDGSFTCTHGDCDDDPATGGAQCAGPTACATFYEDADGDGWATYASARTFCRMPTTGTWVTFVEVDDCDDSDPTCVYYEDCVDYDQDSVRLCSGDLDDLHPYCTTDLTDADGDGICAGHDCSDDPAGLGARAFRSCTTCQDGDGDGLWFECDRYSVSGFSTFDCDDSSTAIGYDEDGDGAPACGFTPDCNDANPLMGPGRPERCNDTVDNDCDGATDSADLECAGQVDPDGDGYVGDSDCSPSDPNVHWGDHDNDGYSSCNGDCDDADPLTAPDRNEMCAVPGDEDCDSGADYNDYYDCTFNSPVDVDGDGVSSYSDCDDGNPDMNFEDLDQDGYSSCAGASWADCDDLDASAFPFNAESCSDGVDNDCDGYVDGVDYECGSPYNP